VDLQATCDNPSETWVLDTFWQKTLGKRHVFFVKIDIEGFEPFAIKGGMQMFREAPPMIISMEVTPRDSASRGLTVHDMMKDLYDIGYTARTGPEFSNSPIIKPGTPRWDQLFINNPDLSDIILIHKKTYEKYLQGSVQTFSNP
jgi:hypothetical protein